MEQRSRVTVPSHYCIVDIFILIVRDRAAVAVMCLPVSVSLSVCSLCIFLSSLYARLYCAAHYTSLYVSVEHRARGGHNTVLHQTGVRVPVTH